MQNIACTRRGHPRMAEQAIPAGQSFSFTRVQHYAALAALIALILFNVAVTPHFVSLQTFHVNRYRIQPTVATLVLFIAGRGVAQVLTNGNLQTFRAPGFQWIGLGHVAGLPVQTIIMLAIVGVAAWALQRTLFGRQVLAVG